MEELNTPNPQQSISEAFDSVNWIKGNPGMFTAGAVGVILVGTLIQRLLFRKPLSKISLIDL